MRRRSLCCPTVGGGFGTPTSVRTRIGGLVQRVFGDVLPNRLEPDRLLCVDAPH